MKKLLFAISVITIIAFGSNLSAATSVDIGISADDGGIKSFHLAISQHYGVSTRSIEIVKKEKLSDEEMAVVFFLSERIALSSRDIARLRLKGMSWMEIIRRYNQTAAIFYFDVKDAGGPPYGKAYGHFKGKKRKQWRTMKLTNRQVIDLVNLRFLSAHYGYSTAEIIKMRNKGTSFVKISKKVKHIQKQKREKAQVTKAIKKNKAIKKDKVIQKKKVRSGKGR